MPRANAHKPCQTPPTRTIPLTNAKRTHPPKRQSSIRPALLRVLRVSVVNPPPAPARRTAQRRATKIPRPRRRRTRTAKERPRSTPRGRSQSVTSDDRLHHVHVRLVRLERIPDLPVLDRHRAVLAIDARRRPRHPVQVHPGRHGRRRVVQHDEVRLAVVFPPRHPQAPSTSMLTPEGFLLVISAAPIREIRAFVFFISPSTELFITSKLKPDPIRCGK